MRLHLFLLCCEVVANPLKGCCEVLCLGPICIELCSVGGWSAGLETIKSKNHG